MEADAPDPVVVTKVAQIERCLQRVHEEYGDGVAFASDVRRQDAAILNLLRACETSIDLAMHLTRVLRLGVPKRSRDAFAELVRAGIIEEAVGTDLQRMVGFRNLAVHRYEEIDLEIVRSIMERELRVFEAFGAAALRAGPR